METIKTDVKTAIYMRISTEEQSIEAQMRAITSFLQYKGISQYQIYKDEGFSGKNSDRPALKQLLNEAKQGTIDLIVVWKLDRLSRSLSDLIALLKRLNEHNVKFASVTEQIDMSTPHGVMMMQMIGVFAEFERNMIIARTKAALAVKKANGVHCGRPNSVASSTRDLVIELYNYGATKSQIIHSTRLPVNKIDYILRVYRSSTAYEVTKDIKDIQKAPISLTVK
jgi:DNA invertase Pin-like site-specific DNA recombinase